MALLIAVGSLLTVAVAPNVGRVALASTAAFALAGIANAVTYHVFRSRTRYVRMNISNACAAITDSIVFPLVAFAAVDSWLSATQAGSKFVGGLLWSALAVGILSLVSRRKLNVD